MQTIADVMTREVITVAPQESLRRVAQLMGELNVGVLPVCDGETLIGMITDRDITVRATAAGAMPEQARVEQVMSTSVHWCFDNQDVEDVIQQMMDNRIRRVPVIGHETEKLVGIVTLGDLAAKHSAGGDHTLEDISSPSQPDRSRLH